MPLSVLSLQVSGHHTTDVVVCWEYAEWCGPCIFALRRSEAMLVTRSAETIAGCRLEVTDQQCRSRVRIQRYGRMYGNPRKAIELRSPKLGECLQEQAYLDLGSSHPLAVYQEQSPVGAADLMYPEGDVDSLRASSVLMIYYQSCDKNYRSTTNVVHKGMSDTTMPRRRLTTRMSYTTTF